MTSPDFNLRQLRKTFRGIKTKGPKNTIYTLLYFLPEFRYKIFELTSSHNPTLSYLKNTKKIYQSILTGFSELFNEYHNTLSSAILSTSMITNNLSKNNTISLENNYINYDVFEFLKIFITTFCLDSNKNDSIYFQNIFCFETLSNKICNNCNINDINYQSWINLTIPYSKLMYNDGNNVDIREYLKKMLGDKVFVCKNCKREGEEKLYCNGLPKLLCIKINRSRKNFQETIDDKIKLGYISTPFTLNINNIINTSKYNINKNINNNKFNKINNILLKMKTNEIIFDKNIDKYIMKECNLFNININNNNNNNNNISLNNENLNNNINNYESIINTFNENINNNKNNNYLNNKKRRNSFQLFNKHKKILNNNKNNINKNYKHKKTSSFIEKTFKKIKKKDIKNDKNNDNNNIINEKIINNSFIYDLFAVIYHRGIKTKYIDNSQYGIYIKDTMKEAEWGLDFAENQDHWFKFEDDKVSKVYINEIKSCFGAQKPENPLSYIVFYKQRLS